MDNDSLFHVIEDAQAVLLSKGVFRQVKVFRREGKLYAAWGSGYVRLLSSGGTSHPNVSWVSLPDDPAIKKTPLGITYGSTVVEMRR